MDGLRDWMVFGTGWMRARSRRCLLAAREATFREALAAGSILDRPNCARAARGITINAEPGGGRRHSSPARVHLLLPVFPVHHILDELNTFEYHQQSIYLH